MSPGRVSPPTIFQATRPLVFAHRGGAKLAPENTIPAFDSGIAHGADGFELDVHLSADGIPVVIHDPTLDRTTDQAGPVRARTMDDLARVDAGYACERDGTHPFRGQGIGVPTLETVLRRYPSARVIIEMKGGQAELAVEVARVVKRCDAIDRICVGSFNQTAIDALRSASPDIATGASQEEARWTLHRSWVRWPWIGERPYVAFQVPEWVGRMRVVSRRFIRQVHQEGQVVQVWVVDKPEDAARLFDWGVDGLITDRPDVTVPARDLWKP